MKSLWKTQNLKRSYIFTYGIPKTPTCHSLFYVRCHVLFPRVLQTVVNDLFVVLYKRTEPQSITMHTEFNLSSKNHSILIINIIFFSTFIDWFKFKPKETLNNMFRIKIPSLYKFPTTSTVFSFFTCTLV